MASKVALQGLKEAFDAILTGATVKALLVTDAYTFANTHNYVANVVSAAAAGANRPTMTDVTVTIDTATGDGQLELDCANYEFTGVTTGQNAGGIWYYVEVTDDADSYLLAFGDPTDLPGNGSAMAVTVAAEGFAKITI